VPLYRISYIYYYFHACEIEIGGKSAGGKNAGRGFK